MSVFCLGWWDWRTRQGSERAVTQPPTRSCLRRRCFQDVSMGISSTIKRLRFVAPVNPNIFYISWSNLFGGYLFLKLLLCWRVWIHIYVSTPEMINNCKIKKLLFEYIKHFFILIFRRFSKNLKTNI